MYLVVARRVDGEFTRGIEVDNHQVVSRSQDEGRFVARWHRLVAVGGGGEGGGARFIELNAIGHDRCHTRHGEAIVVAAATAVHTAGKDEHGVLRNVEAHIGQASEGGHAGHCQHVALVVKTPDEDHPIVGIVVGKVEFGTFENDLLNDKVHVGH